MVRIMVVAGEQLGMMVVIMIAIIYDSDGNKSCKSSTILPL